ncbi:Uma2 family endonuclease [Kitasatospora sp. NPDC059577]|uniref:Uma2 family endonuclease n=1 Tax=unclassified Kitasatospora TaxID=2633591 RepID=UPI0036AF1591
MSIEQYPDWLRPPVGGYTAEDLDRLPDLPPHTELIDGSLIFVSPQTIFHMSTLRVLEWALVRAVPPGWAVWREMTIMLNRRNRLEPDLLVVDKRVNSGPRGRKGTSCQPEDVLLAVEVVSEESQERDRDTKPRKYAAAGIAHFWRVEDDDDGRPVVYVYELDPATRAYGLTGIYHKQLKVDRPFPVEIDLTDASE